MDFGVYTWYKSCLDMWGVNTFNCSGNSSLFKKIYIKAYIVRIKGVTIYTFGEKKNF